MEVIANRKFIILSDEIRDLVVASDNIPALFFQILNKFRI